MTHTGPLGKSANLIVELPKKPVRRVQIVVCNVVPNIVEVLSGVRGQEETVSCSLLAARTGFFTNLGEDLFSVNSFTAIKRS